MSKYIFIDIDGTLLSHNVGIPESAKEAIHLARMNGHKVFINTGRVKSAVDAIIRSMPFDGYVYAAGAHIEFNNETFYESTINENDIKQLVDLFEETNVGYILEGSLISYYNKKAIAFYNQRMENRKDLDPQVMRHMIQENMVVPLSHYHDRPTPINKCSIFASSIDEIYKLNEMLDDRYQFIIYDENSSGEIIIKDINKASGIMRVVDHFGATMDDAVALGDSMNDYEMVKEAGIGIAMGTSDKRLQAVADYITFDVEDGGIFHAFKKFDLI